MIDTIRFIIPYDQEIVEAIKAVGTTVIMSYDTDSRIVKFAVARGNQTFGSYNRNVNLIIREDKEQLSLELSIPKYIYGHNVFLFYPQELETAVYKLWNDLTNVYNCVFPSPEDWEVVRLDLCYNWRFGTQSQAVSVLSHLKNVDFPRKSKGKQLYNTGVFHKAGRLHSVKFYLKQPEFFVHDFQMLKKSPQTLEMAYQFHTWSAGVLRFEVSLHNAWIKKKFPQQKKNYHIATQYDKISAVLGEFLTDYLKSVNCAFMTLDVALEKLKSIYTETEARNLLQFWVLTHTFDSQTTNNLLFKGMDKSVLYKMKKRIIKADIGIFNPDNDITSHYDLKIPSQFTTNFPPFGEGAEAPADDLQNTDVY